MFKPFDVVLDVSNKSMNNMFEVSTNDLNTIRLDIKVKEGLSPFNLTGKIVRLAIQKPDKTVVFQTGGVTDGAAGLCEITLSRQANVVEGRHEAELMIFEGDQAVAVTTKFFYNVKKALLNDDVVKSTSDFPAISQAIEAGEALKDIDVPVFIEAANNAVNEANNAGIQAGYAKTQGDYAKQEADNAVVRLNELNGVDAVQFKDRQDGFDAKLVDDANYVLKASDFNIKPSNLDNHDNIISALEKLKLNGGGTLLLPFGVIKTSPVDFTGYHNIVIKGVGKSYPMTVNTTIKIVGTNPAGSIGLKFADSTNPYPDNYSSWISRFCKLEGIFLECDNKCDVGINGNRGLELTDVTVRRARVDGIVLEDFTYPTYLQKVESSYNGRHGLYARGKMSTVYTASDVEFTGNGGYGIYIEGGASPCFTNVLLQSNKVGGLKINKISGYTGSYFLSEVMFINLYTEANGTLLNTDPAYEGNCSIYITGHDKTNSSSGKPTNLKFIGGKINAISGGISVKIDSVWGCKFDTQISGNVDIATTGVYGLEFATVASSAMLPTGALGSSLTSYRPTTGIQGIMYNGGLFPSRGRTMVLEFHLPTITAGATVNMNGIYQTMASMTMAKGYSMMKDGSILGLRLVKKGVGSAGTITCKPVFYAGPVLYVDPPNIFPGGFTNLVLNCATSNKVSGFYNPDIFKFSADYVVGIQLTASADYAAGTYDGYVAQLMIEI